MQLAVHVAVLFPFYFYRVGAFLSVPQPYSFIFSGAVRFPIHIPRQSGTTMATSYDTDSDDSDKLQRQRGTSLGSSSETSGSRMFPGDSSATRYDDLIADVGLEGKLKHAGDLPPQHAISCYDIFCNRELKQEKLAAVGFDMDYTLAQYHQPVFDKLGFDGAKEKLVHKFGYPKEALDFEYDHSRWTRGLIIDTERGNFLKIDRHKYVRVAYHGMDEIPSLTRKQLYSNNFNKVESFSEKSFVNLDTLFQFVDAHMFALLVDMKDKSGNKFLQTKSYAELYRDVRRSVDLCHRDGAIKNEVAKHPEKYIVLDKGMIPMLKRYSESGTKVFLLTNSYWEYTATVMNFLYHGKRVDPELQKKNEWTQLFDLCIVGSCKPTFMLDPYLQLFRINMDDGSLYNTDGLYEIDSLGENGAQEFLKQGKVFQGGNWQHLHKMLEISSGDEILYVGDHLYSDVLRSKRTLGWRSLFIMPELEDEIRVFNDKLPLRIKIERLRMMRDELGAKAESIRLREDAQDPNIKVLLDELAEDDALIKSALSRLAARWHAAFHPIWGAMFNAGYQGSRFAFYVENYACLYTSRASNLGLTSKYRRFRTTTELVPHDRLLALGDVELIDAGARA